jgi:hypothetical protein
MQGAYTLNLQSTSTDIGLLTSVRDAYLRDAVAGSVPFLFDTAFPFSYPAGSYLTRAAAAAPINNAVIGNIAELGDGKFVKDASTVAYSGGGFDFSTAGTGLTYIQGPSNTFAGIQTQQYFMIVIYMMMPSLANINSQGTIQPFFTASSLGGYQVAPDIGLMCFNGTSANAIGFRRETAVGSQAGVAASCVGHNGQMTQVAVWRNATEMGIRFKSSAGGTTVATAATGSNNTADFSALPPMFGSVYQYNGNSLGRNYKIYRGAIENLALSGRIPATVLDADWARVQTRIAASAAANGGTSTIFV